MSRLTWAKAQPVIGGLFEQWPPQWPQRLAPIHLARLQYPPNGKDWALTAACEEAISAACAAGELAHEMGEFKYAPSRVVVAGERFTMPGLADLPSLDQMLGRDSGYRRRPAPPTRRPEMVPTIAAGDFVAWLRGQRDTPSEHIAAWMEATAPEPAPVELDQEAPAPAPDPQRRLALLRSLGGNVKWLSGKWEVTRMAALVQHERGSPRSSEKTIRADLRKAAEAERREGAQRPNWHP